MLPLSHGVGMPAAFAVAGLLLLLPAQAAFAKLERGSSGGRGNPAAGPAPETGGLRIVPSGPLRLSCSHFGAPIFEGRGIDRLGVSPLSALGWLSFRSSAGAGRSMVLPLPDGATTCVVTQESRYPRRPPDPPRQPVDERRSMAWHVPQAAGPGQVELVRTWRDASGRFCGDLAQSVRIGTRVETAIGSACWQDGAWQPVR